MLRAADRQHGFFDAAWCADLLAADSFYVLLAEHGERIVRDEDFADCYSETHGRPSIPPSLLSKVLLLCPASRFSAHPLVESCGALAAGAHETARRSP